MLLVSGLTAGGLGPGKPTIPIIGLLQEDSWDKRTYPRVPTTRSRGLGGFRDQSA